MRTIDSLFEMRIGKVNVPQCRDIDMREDLQLNLQWQVQASYTRLGSHFQWLDVDGVVEDFRPNAGVVYHGAMDRQALP